MEKCEFCEVLLESEASFCGNCGHVHSKASSQATSLSDLPLAAPGEDTVAQVDFPDPDALPDSNEATLLRPLSILPLSGNDELTFQSEHTLSMPDAQTNTSLEDLPTKPLLAIAQQDRDEEEEKRRRAALVGLSVPLLSGLAQPPASNAPVLAGTPQIGQVPLLSGTPQLGSVGPGFAASGNPPFAAGSGIPQSAPYMPGSGSPAPYQPTNPSPGSPGSGPQGPATGGAPGCVLTLIIVLTALFLILASVVTLGLTAWAPNLALSGTTTVSPGGTMTLHGSSFLPNSSVDLTLDSNIPVYYLQRSIPVQLADVSLLNASQSLQFSAQGKDTLTVPGNGTFILSFLVNPTWSAGPHTITAYETLTHRHASANFTITGVATTATSTATPSPTPTNMPTSTSTSATTIPAPTPTNTPTANPTHTVVVPTPTPTHTAVPTPKPTPSPTPTPLPGRLSASPLRINGNGCSVVKLNFDCQITLTNSSRLTPLSWSVAFSNYTRSSPTVQASSHTIKAASSETVTLLVPTSDQSNTITITFTGPANSATVTWYYQVIIQ